MEVIMPENPLKIIETQDPDLFKNVQDTRALALSDGALPSKTKLLMAMALDASLGTVDGVRSLALAALNAGATKEEIMETVRVAQFISGAGCVYTAARALEGIL
jgi:alkylhydroperoxidase/carboxymuconolactone decarboxylase family protein YurZ